MSADISAILDDLAAGRITSEEARRRIDDAQSASQADVSGEHVEADHDPREGDGGSAQPWARQGTQGGGHDDVTGTPAQEAHSHEQGAQSHEQGSGGAESQDQAAHGSRTARSAAGGPGTGQESAGQESTSRAGDGGRQPHGEDWRSRIPPEAREGLRSAWQVVSGVAESVAGAASGSAGRGPGPRRAAQTSSPTTPPRAGEEAESVSLHCTGKRVHVVADETVSGVHVDGGHTRRRVGRVAEVTIEGHLAPDLSNLLRLQVPKGIDDVKDLSLGREVMVRVNPGLCLDVEISGGSLHCEGVARVGSLRVTAGAAEIDGVHEVRDGLVQAATVSLGGPIDTGRSRLRVESGNLTVNLDPQANVSVRATARSGVVSWPESGEVDEYVVGNGSARMDISVVLGRAAIRHR